MQIETIEIAGFASALKALRLPYNKGAKSEIDCTIDTAWCAWHYENGEITDSPYVDTESRIGFCPDDLDLMRTLILRGDSHAKPIRGILAYAKIVAPIHFWWDLETYRAGHERLFSASTMNTEGKQLHGKELAKALDNVSFSRPICKIDFFSYQCLRNIIKQRYNHRKLEWHEFIEWIKSLPLASTLIYAGLEQEMKLHDELYRQYLSEE